MIKYFIGDYRKKTFWGDMHATENGYYFPFEGKILQVKLFGLFWVTYHKVQFNID